LKKNNKSTIAQERGYRLDLAIKIARLSLAQFLKKSDIPQTTLYAWRKGLSSLSYKGATLVSKVLGDSGYFCDPHWLLTGEGLGLVPKEERGSNINIILDYTLDSTDLLNETNKILKEVELFKALYPNTLFLMIVNNNMSPYYRAGDYVAGSCLEANFNDALNKSCIIETKEGETLIRNIYKDPQKNLFILTVFDLSSSNNCIIMEEKDILNIAPIVWHRRPILK